MVINGFGITALRGAKMVGVYGLGCVFAAPLDTCIPNEFSAREPD